MKVLFSGSSLLTSFESKLTLLEPLSPDSNDFKEIWQQTLGEEFLIIKMLEPDTFATIGYDKKFRIWRLLPSKALAIQYCCSFPKKLSHGTSGVLGGKEYCFIADKYGDVYMIDIAKAISSQEQDDKIIRQDFLGPTKEEDLLCKFIMGHQEIISLVLMTEDFIVTIDKANKVKVTKIPKFFDIQGIHFAHKEEVIFASIIRKHEMITLDKAKEVIVWDISKEDTNAVLFKAKLATGNILATAMLANQWLAIADDNKLVWLYNVQISERKIIEKGKKALPENIQILEILEGKTIGESLRIMGINDKTKTAQVTIIDF